MKNRFLPIPESTHNALECDVKIKDFFILKELGSGLYLNAYLVCNKVTKTK